jgi:2-hydroxychromene-2-carboxylate isomerase
MTEKSLNSLNVAADARPEIEFWFEFASNYSYLSVMRIEQEARRHGVRVLWRPFLLGPIFSGLGMQTSPFLLNTVKGAYVWQDMIRQCRKYGLRWKQPSTFPRLGVLPLRIALLAADQPWIGLFCQQVMELNFVLDEDINRPEAMASILTSMDLPASQLLQQAQSQIIKNRLREQTESARSKGIFGAPTFFVGMDMFWGNDRLDDALIQASLV